MIAAQDNAPVVMLYVPVVIALLVTLPHVKELVPQEIVPDDVNEQVIEVNVADAVDNRNS